MPSCLTFGSLIATAILFDFDLDERINPNAYILKLSVHPSVHVRICLFVKWNVCVMCCENYGWRILCFGNAEERGKSENERKRETTIHAMSETILQIMLHSIRCFDGVLVLDSENAFTYCIPKLCCWLMDCAYDSERMGWDLAAYTIWHLTGFSHLLVDVYLELQTQFDWQTYCIIRFRFSF